MASGQPKKVTSRDGSSRTSSNRFSVTSVAVLLASHALSFFGGTFYSSNEVFMSHFQPEPPEFQHPQYATTAACPRCPACPSANITTSCPTCPTCPSLDATNVQRQAQSASTPSEKNSNGKQQLFPETVRKYAVGMSYTTKQEFAEKFEPGVPFDAPQAKGDQDVLFLYTSTKSLPNKMKEGHSSSSVDYISVDEATENCNIMHMILNHRGGDRQQCLAIVPQYESHHIMKYMRVPERGPGDPSLPLRLVSRAYEWNGVANFAPPKSDRHTKRFWELLRTYLNSFDSLVTELKPIAKKIAIKNTIIVMTCNLGQSQLLLNFVCSARSRGLDISNVLIFATDLETKELAESIGLTAYYNEENFGHLPTKAAEEYGDNTFVLMMMAKIICVHLVSRLGHDLLFQDVDVIWHKNPLDYFHDKNSPIANFDCYFQDDGARSLRYSPYSANSGFYYIRSNSRTQYFVNSVLMAGDIILQTMSHQQALIAVLSEHASLFGLKVKVLSREDDGFPGGFHFHQRRKRYFEDFFKGQKDPYIFHMSWTTNKNNKLLFLRQLGEWYVQDQCIDKKLSEIPLLGSDAEASDNDNRLAASCCSSEAIFSCHYRDKPSIKPCTDSPPIDKNAASFWDAALWEEVQKLRKNVANNR